MVDPAKRFSIEGKSVIVTGASGAMGSEAAKALGAAGANVTLAGGNAAALEEIAALPELAGRSTIVARRPDSLADAEAIVSGALAAYGRLDGMLVASGMNKVGLIQDPCCRMGSASDSCQRPCPHRLSFRTHRVVVCRRRQGPCGTRGHVRAHPTQALR